MIEHPRYNTQSLSKSQEIWMAEARLLATQRKIALSAAIKEKQKADPELHCRLFRNNRGPHDVSAQS